MKMKLLVPVVLLALLAGLAIVLAACANPPKPGGNTGRAEAASVPSTQSLSLRLNQGIVLETRSSHLRGKLDLHSLEFSPSGDRIVATTTNGGFLLYARETTGKHFSLVGEYFTYQSDSGSRPQAKFLGSDDHLLGMTRNRGSRDVMLFGVDDPSSKFGQLRLLEFAGWRESFSLFQHTTEHVSFSDSGRGFCRVAIRRDADGNEVGPREAQLRLFRPLEGVPSLHTVLGGEGYSSDGVDVRGVVKLTLPPENGKLDGIACSHDLVWAAGVTSDQPGLCIWKPDAGHYFLQDGKWSGGTAALMPLGAEHSIHQIPEDYGTLRKLTFLGTQYRFLTVFVRPERNSNSPDTECVVTVWKIDPKTGIPSIANEQRFPSENGLVYQDTCISACGTLAFLVHRRKDANRSVVHRIVLWDAESGGRAACESSRFELLGEYHIAAYSNVTGLLALGTKGGFVLVSPPQ